MDNKKINGIYLNMDVDTERIAYERYESVPRGKRGDFAKEAFILGIAISLQSSSLFKTLKRMIEDDIDISRLSFNDKDKNIISIESKIDMLFSMQKEILSKINNECNNTNASKNKDCNQSELDLLKGSGLNLDF